MGLTNEEFVPRFDAVGHTPRELEDTVAGSTCRPDPSGEPGDAHYSPAIRPHDIERERGRHRRRETVADGVELEH